MLNSGLKHYGARENILIFIDGLEAKIIKKEEIENGRRILFLLEITNDLRHAFPEIDDITTTEGYGYFECEFEDCKCMNSDSTIGRWLCITRWDGTLTRLSYWIMKVEIRSTLNDQQDTIQALTMKVKSQGDTIRSMMNDMGGYLQEIEDLKNISKNKEKEI